MARRPASSYLFACTIVASLLLLGARGVSAEDARLDVIHSFSTDAKAPSSLLSASDGYFYGTYQAGGPFGGGALFRMSAEGDVTIIHNFDRQTDGEGPTTLIEASDGFLYGSAGPIETHTSTCGVIFRATLAGHVDILHELLPSEGCGYNVTLLEASDGNFYGATQSRGTFDRGTIFRLSRSGTLTVLRQFSIGAPSPLMQANDGNLYFVAGGWLCRMTLAGAFTPLVSGVANHLAGPLTQGSDGLLYGADEGIPQYDFYEPGKIFKTTLDGTQTILRRFGGEFGRYPQTRLIEVSPGRFVGSAWGDSPTVFAIATDGAISQIVGVAASNLIRVAADRLFGLSGGAIVEISLTGSLRVVSAPPQTVSMARPSRLIRTMSGELLGMAESSDVYPAKGYLFRLSASGDVTRLREFAGGTQYLAQSLDGAIFGVGKESSTSQSKLWTLAQDGTYTSFQLPWTATGDSFDPTRSLVETAVGSWLAGTYRNSYDYNVPNRCGAVWRLNRTGVATVVHAFDSGYQGGSGVINSDGCFISSLARGDNGTVYGATSGGGTFGSGTLFEISPQGTFRVVHQFTGGDGVAGPNRLFVGPDGGLYGTTRDVFFRVNPYSGALVALHRFVEYERYASLSQGPGGFYGISYSEALGSEQLFTLSYAGNFTRLKALSRYGRERLLGYPYDASLVWTGGSTFYGVSQYGGTSTYHGAAFRITLPAELTAPPAGVDFDGDQRAELATYRPSTNFWYLRNSAYNWTVGAGITEFQWGDAGDLPVPGDYDGDGKTDPTVYRPATHEWFIRESSLGFDISQYGHITWGANGDTPIPGDFDGDGLTDVAVYQPSTGTWYVRPSSASYGSTTDTWQFQWGLPGDTAVIGDYDGDGKVDVTVYRPTTGEWFIRYSSRNYDAAQGRYAWGTNGDAPLSADFDGDGRTDIGVYRPGTGQWFVLYSSLDFDLVRPGTFAWGVPPSDLPRLVDFDGDGKADLTVYRPTTGEWFVRYSSLGYDASHAARFEWGAPGDLALPTNGASELAATRLSAPLLTIDQPIPGAAVVPPFAVGGWAVDPYAASGTGIDAVHVYAFPAGGGAPIFLGAARYGSTRSDIGEKFGSQFTHSGFLLTVSSLANGIYTIQAFGHSTAANTFSVSSRVTITVGPAPLMSLDNPTSNSTFVGTLTVSGWAIDRAAPYGTGVDIVQVWATPVGGASPLFLGNAHLGRDRPDVARLFGNQFWSSGYVFIADVPPGNYTVNVYMHSSVSQTFSAVMSASNVTVTALPPNPQLAIDLPTTGARIARPFTMSGWAIDTGSWTGTGMDAVHVWAFPIDGGPQVFLGAATYGLERPDVANVFPKYRYVNSGYSLAVTSTNLPAPGTYDFYAFGHSTVTGDFSIVRVVRATVF